MPRKKDEKTKCSICGNINEENNVYCGVCGKKLNQNAENSKQGDEVENLETSDALEIDSSLPMSDEPQNIEDVSASESESSSEVVDEILEDIEEGRIITEVRQVKSAWLWSS